MIYINESIMVFAVLPNNYTIKFEYKAVYLKYCSGKIGTFYHHCINGHKYTTFLENKGLKDDFFGQKVVIRPRS